MNKDIDTNQKIKSTPIPKFKYRNKKSSPVKNSTKGY